MFDVLAKGCHSIIRVNLKTILYTRIIVMGLTCWHFREKGTLVFVDSALVTLILRLFEDFAFILLGTSSFSEHE